MVLGIIAALGLVLAAVGISGVTYRGVVDRTREFAVRLALGSQPAAVVRLVLLESTRDLAIGALAGRCRRRRAVRAARAFAGECRRGRCASRRAFRSAVIAATGIAAAFLPALRIMRVHPAEVLRS